jgi:3-isopropylmalate dehydrogenase
VTERTFQIAVLPGDGIGVDVTHEAVRVLRALESSMLDLQFELNEYPVGANEYLRSGDPLPADTFDACRSADAVLLGAMGLPDVRWPDGREIAPQLDLRERLDLYAGLRPVRLYHDHDSPLKGYRAGDLDMLIVRESTEGLFSSRLNVREPETDQVSDTLLVSRSSVERVCRVAFRKARERRGKVSLIDKANVLPSMVFFREVFFEVARDFPDVKAEAFYVDAAALYLVTNPRQFDVLLTENMFGDILSDLSAGLVGGMGLAPSADIGDHCAVFQPAHGSAPDIAGRGIANPVATILSLAMMLDWLDHPQTKSAALQLHRAVEATFTDPDQRTPDLGGHLTTMQMTDQILGQLGT